MPNQLISVFNNSGMEPVCAKFISVNHRWKGWNDAMNHDVDGQYLGTAFPLIITLSN